MSASGKFVLRLPEGVHRELKRHALREGISLNQICCEILSKGAKERQSLLPDSLRAGIQKKWKSQLQAILLFGSKARQTDTSASDIDLLLVLEGETSINRDLYRQWDELISSLKDKDAHYEKFSPQFVSLPSSASKAGSLWSEVALEGLMLWERGSEVSKLLQLIRDRIARGDLIRKLSHGQPYWVKKEESQHEKR